MQVSQKRLLQGKERSRYEATNYSGNLVSVSEMKDHLKVDGSEEDEYIEILISAAEQWVEKYLNRVLGQRTITEYFDAFSETILRFPVNSVTAVYYQDLDDDQQTLSTDFYQIESVGIPNRFLLADGQTFPETYNKANAVRVVYTSGYSGEGNPMPDAIKAAIYLMVADMFEQREDSVKRYPTAVTRLLALYRINTY